MGLFSRRNFPRVSRSPSILPHLIISAAFVFLALVLYFEVDSLISRTKTVVGHNLEPTPWHLFPPKEEESKYLRASKILQCSYLTCGSAFTSSYQMHKNVPKSTSPPKSCPKFFRNIHRDLEPWKHTKISMNHIMEAQKFAAFRVTIIEGRLYVDFYYACVQTRAMFTIWGILQLLSRYPGKIPDVDLMFECMDKPSVTRNEHGSMPLPLFRYCTTPEHFDIPFPDWSFWGWAETNIDPWHIEFKSIKDGSQAVSFREKIPFAYWKGNPDVGAPIRMALLECNDTSRWGAQILRQNWIAESQSGFKDSKLSKQCNHRYKIYAEGYAWSVSLKYIISCGSLPLIIDPQYEDFFSRGLIPKHNYWPIPRNALCPHIKKVVDWGNTHPSAAEAMGRRAQHFMEVLNMNRVYDYMYHLLTEYAALQDFTPIQPPSAQEMCSDSVLCFANEKEKELLKKSSAYPSSTSPCTIK